MSEELTKASEMRGKIMRIITQRPAWTVTVLEMGCTNILRMCVRLGVEEGSCSSSSGQLWILWTPHRKNWQVLVIRGDQSAGVQNAKS